MRKIATIRMKFRGDRYEFYIWEHDGEYSLHLTSNHPEMHHRFDISRNQVKKIAKDIEEHLNLQVKLAEFVPTDPQIVDAFERFYTGSGKLMTIMNILDADPTVKEWVHKTLNGEPLL